MPQNPLEALSSRLMKNLAQTQDAATHALLWAEIRSMDRVIHLTGVFNLENSASLVESAIEIEKSIRTRVKLDDEKTQDLQTNPGQRGQEI